MKKITLYLMILFTISTFSQEIVIGNGTTSTTSTGADPIDGYYAALKYQAVYLASELNSSLSPYDEITSLGWSISGDYAGGILNGYTIKIGHTSAIDSGAHDSSALTTVKSSFDYDPTVTAEGEFDMISFDTNFIWNGVDNIVVEVCTNGPNAYTSPFGTVRKTDLTSGSRSYRSDSNPACDYDTTSTHSYRPNIKFSYIAGTPPSCIAPSGLTISNITSSSVDFLWTAGGTEVNYEYVVQAAGTGEPTAAGTAVTGSTTASESGLTAISPYEVYVRSNCDTDGFSSWTGPLSFTTLCEAFDVPYSENFDSTATGTSSNPTVPNCWSFIDGGSGYGYVSSTGANSFYLYNFSDMSGDYILVSPETNALSSGTNRVSFDVDGSMSQELIVGTLSDPADSSTFTAIETITLATNDYESYVVNIPSGTDLHVGFKHGQTGTYDSYYLDNIVVEAIPSCLEVTDLITSDLTSSSAALSWTADASQSLFNVEVVDITAGGSVTGTPTHSGVANPYTLTGLTANNDYEFYVQADCGGGDLSTWSGPASFYTGYCVPSNTSSSTYINSFSTTGASVNVDNTSTGYTNSGYGDYSQETAIETFPGGSFDFSASIVGGTVGFALWIDLNNDLVFDTTSEVLFNTTSYGSGPFTGTIEIPSDLAEGNYRLRMMIDYSDSNPSAATGDSTCSFNSTRGEVEDYTVTLVAPPTDAMDWNNIQWLAPAVGDGSRTSLNIDAGTSITAYAQGYEGGVTDTTVGSAGAGIECWIGIHNENTDPATWPASAWSVATFDSEQGNNDEYKLTTADAPVGTNYVASRWRLNNAGFTYGGTNPSDPGQTPGGPWDGTTNVSIQLVVNPIANDDCSGAIALAVNSDLECGTVTSGSVEFATDSSVSNSTCSGTEDDDVWYNFVATSETHVVSLSNVSGTSTDMYHVLYAGDCNTLGDAIKCSDANTSETSGLTIGNTYYVQVYTYTSTPGQNTSFDICVGTPPPPPANDNCSGVIDLASLTSPVSGSTTYASNDFILGCLSSSSAKDVIYSIQVPDGATLSIGQTSNAYDSKHSLRYGNTCPGDQLIVCTDDSDTQTETWVNNTGADQTVYWIQSAYSTGSGDYTLSWTMTPLSVDGQTLKQFTYFPNPVNDMLTIKAQKDVDHITVYNMLGQVVKRQTPNTRDCTVDLSAMQAGAYFVQVSVDNSVETVRILKN